MASLREVGASSADLPGRKRVAAHLVRVLLLLSPTLCLHRMGWIESEDRPARLTIPELDEHPTLVAPIGSDLRTDLEVLALVNETTATEVRTKRLPPILLNNSH